MKKFKKYEFDSEGQADLFIENLGIDEDGNKTHSNEIIKLGFLTIEHATYDEDNNELTPIIYSDKYSVDVIWHDQKDKDWKDYRIKLNGKENSHLFGGWDYSDNIE